METSPQKRWLCNELLYELCKEIPTAKTSDQILLSAHNMYVYLEPLFSKKLIYRDLIAFLKAKSKAKEYIDSRIRVDQNKESEQIVMIKQKQWNYKDKTNFKLETNKFRIQITTGSYNRNAMFISDSYDQLECPHLLYFLRLIAPLLQPIQFYLNYDLSRIPIARLIRFMSTQSDWIDSIALWDNHFDSEPIYGALRKYNRLKIYVPINPNNVQKIIPWLTSDNNNQSKKYLILEQNWPDDGLVLLIKELKKEFIYAKSKSRFVVRLKLREQLDEFTACNELTGERLQLLLKNIEQGQYIHALSRFPDIGLDANENDFAELDPLTKIYLR